MKLHDTIDVLIGGYLSKDAAEEDYNAVLDCGGHLQGAVIVSKDLEGNLSVEQTDHMVREGAEGLGAIGFAVGLFAPPAVLATTAVGAAIGAGAGELLHHEVKAETRRASRRDDPDRRRRPDRRLLTLRSREGRTRRHARRQEGDRRGRRQTRPSAEGRDRRRPAEDGSRHRLTGLQERATSSLSTDAHPSAALGASVPNDRDQSSSKGAADMSPTSAKSTGATDRELATRPTVAWVRRERQGCASVGRGAGGARKAARAEVPRSVHGEWLAPSGRRDPVELLEEQAASRVPELVPIRYGRMLVSPFTFYRGAAYLMAADLARSPRTGLSVQLCGDAHLSNFGAFAAPDRRLVFDVNDFDETLPGPFEWDLKRLVASFAVAGRDLGFPSRSAPRR